jgi:transposase-like protein
MVGNRWDVDETYVKVNGEPVGNCVCKALAGFSTHYSLPHAQEQGRAVSIVKRLRTSRRATPP